MPRAADNPYLSGNFAPVPDETRIHALDVDGVIPAGLHGQYVRIGPNPIGTPGRASAWNGDGMVHAVTLRAGHAPSYRNRWIMTARASALLGTEAPGGDAAATDEVADRDVVSIAGHVIAIGDQSVYELDGALQTRRRVEIVSGDQRLWKRGRLDPTTRALHLISSTGNARNARHHVLSAAGAVCACREVALGRPVHGDDFLVTEHFVVLFVRDAIGIVEHGGERVEWFAARSAVRHLDPIGAFEEGPAVWVYVATPSLVRCVLDPGHRTIVCERLDRVPCAHARFDEHHRAASPRYLYALAPSGVLPYSGTAIDAYDLTAGSRVRHDFGLGRHPGELVFVGDPTRRDREDGGWLVGFVHDDRTERAELVVLDAADVGAPPLATVHIPRRVPYGHHGVWVPSRPMGPLVTARLQRSDSSPDDPSTT